jgi:hypothetical protein
MCSKLDQVKNVDIDSGGRFKYILVKVKDGANEKYIVRGYRRAGYHGMFCILMLFWERHKHQFSPSAGIQIRSTINKQQKFYSLQ